MIARETRNVLSNSSNKSLSPFEMMFTEESLLDHMRVFGEPCYSHVSKEKHKNLDDTGVKCSFLREEPQCISASECRRWSIVISRSVTISEHPITQTTSIKVQYIFDKDDKEDMTTPSYEEVEVETPPDEKYALDTADASAPGAST